MGISPHGTDYFLRLRLRKHLASLRDDDRAIKVEGVESLTTEELSSAVRARGMRTPFGAGSEEYMR